MSLLLRTIARSLVILAGVSLLVSCGSSGGGEESGALPSPELEGVIQGRLVATDGEPLAEQHVSAARASSMPSELSAQAVGVAVTDAEGRFALDVQGAGTYLLTFRDTTLGIGAVHHVEVRESDGGLIAAPITMQSADLGAVTGSVEKPTSGIMVFLSGTSLLAMTDETGRFAITGVPAGTFAIRAAIASHAGASRTVTVEPGAVTELDENLVVGPTVVDTSPAGFHRQPRDPATWEALPFPITISGSGFGDRKGVSELRYAGLEVPSIAIASWSNDEIVVRSEMWSEDDILPGNASNNSLLAEQLLFEIDTVAGTASSAAVGAYRAFLDTVASRYDGGQDVFSTTEVATTDGHVEIWVGGVGRLSGVEVAIGATNATVLDPDTGDPIASLTTSATDSNGDPSLQIVTDGWLPVVATADAGLDPAFADGEAITSVVRGARLQPTQGTTAPGLQTFEGRILAENGVSDIPMPDDGNFSLALMDGYAGSGSVLVDAPVSIASDGSFAVDLDVPIASEDWLTLAVLYEGADVAWQELAYSSVAYDDTAFATDWTAATLVDAPIAYTTSLAPSASTLLKVDLPTSSREAVYYELDQNLTLTVLDASEVALASSTTADYFTSGEPATLSVATTRFGTQDVSAQLACRGSCVIEPATTDTRYVRIVNEGSSDATVNLRLIVRDFEDSNEGANTPVITVGTTQGALETLGDVDRYSVEASGTLELVGGALASGLEYRARVVDANGTVVETLLVGDPSVAIRAGDEIVVDAVNGGDRAGAAGKSVYYLGVQ